MTLKHSELGKCLPPALHVGKNVWFWHSCALIPTCGHNRNEETFVILFLPTLKVIGGMVCLTMLAVNRTVGVWHLFNVMFVIPLCLSNIYEYKISVTTQPFIM